MVLFKTSAFVWCGPTVCIYKKKNLTEEAGMFSESCIHFNSPKAFLQTEMQTL